MGLRKKLKNGACLLCGTAALASGGSAQETTTYSYDDLGRLIQVDYNDDDSQKYNYDPAGNRLQVDIGYYDSPANDPPIPIQDNATINEDGSITISPVANDADPEGDTLSLASVAPANNGQAVKNGNDVQYTPTANWNGTDSFTYTVSDGTSTSTGTIEVTVNPVNDAPNAVNDSRTTNEDTAKTFDPRGNDTDVDNTLGQLLITQVTQGSKGTVSITTDSKKITYSPHANKNGSDSFTYTISDGQLTDTATVSMTINPVNDAPVAVNDSFSNVDKTQWTTLSLIGNDIDVDGDALTTASTSGATGEVQIINGGAHIRYRCLSGCMSEDLFTYVVSDGSLTDTGNVVLFLTGGGGGGFPPF